MTIETILPMPDIFSAKRILCVQPHYDNNDIAAAGILTQLAKRGAELIYLTVTDDRVTSTQRAATCPSPPRHRQFLDRSSNDMRAKQRSRCLAQRTGPDQHAHARHPALRTVFVEREGQPLQAVLPPMPLAIGRLRTGTVADRS